MRGETESGFIVGFRSYLSHQNGGVLQFNSKSTKGIKTVIMAL